MQSARNVQKLAFLFSAEECLPWR